MNLTYDLTLPEALELLFNGVAELIQPDKPSWRNVCCQDSPDDYALGLNDKKELRIYFKSRDHWTDVCPGLLIGNEADYRSKWRKVK